MLALARAPIASQVDDCSHDHWTDHGEGMRSCPFCRTVQRMEKRRIPEQGPDGKWLPQWYWRELDPETGHRLLTDLKKRKNS